MIRRSSNHKTLNWNFLLIGCVLFLVYQNTLAPLRQLSNHQLGQNLPSIPTPLLGKMAPTVFSMNPHDPTKILFPPNVQHVIIDIGARESDYLAALEQHQDPTIALILVDPLPESVLPLVSRAALYNLQQGENNTHKYYPDPEFGDRVFVLRGAMADTEEPHTNFHMGMDPSCGSILKSSKTNSFWCWETVRELVVSVFRLESLLNMIPINSIHVKVDAEGADHFVLKGGGKALERVSSIAIECAPAIQNATKPGSPSRDGMCENSEVIEWMCKHRNFCGHSLEEQGSLSNIFFWNLDASILVPDILTQSPIHFRKWYQELQRK